MARHKGNGSHSGGGGGGGRGIWSRFKSYWFVLGCILILVVVVIAVVVPEEAGDDLVVPTAAPVAGPPSGSGGDDDSGGGDGDGKGGEVSLPPTPPTPPPSQKPTQPRPTVEPTQRPTRNPISTTPTAPPGLDACASGHKPNIVVFYTDDQGYGEREITNGHILSMPNYETVAANGIDFKNGHSHSGICSPSRYTLLTGEYYFRKKAGRGALKADAPPLITEETPTLPRMLQENGYRTYMAGKWHIGMKMPNDLANGEIYGGPMEAGFDRFYGIPASMNYGYLSWIQDRKFLEEPSHFTNKVGGRIQSCPGVKTYELARCSSDSKACKKGEYRNSESGGWKIKISPNYKPDFALSNITKAATDFIDDHMSEYGSTVPFFLYMPMTSSHLPHVPHPDFLGTNDYGTYADFLEETDFRLGELLTKLKEHNIFDDTLLIVTSDNGPEGRGKFDRSGLKVAAGLKGQKRTLYEGGNRVPFLVQWPAKLAKGAVVPELAVSQADLYRTVAQLIGEEGNLGEGAPDSFSVWNLMCNPTGVTAHDQMRNRQPMLNENSGNEKGGYIGISVRCGKWKSFHDGKGLRLFNLEDDLAESKNLKSKNGKFFNRLQDILKEVRKNGFSEATKCDDMFFE